MGAVNIAKNFSNLSRGLDPIRKANVEDVELEKLKAACAPCEE
jgi:hypothetical protein